MSDMVRATLSLKNENPEEMIKVFEELNNIDNLKIIRIKNKLTEDLQNVTLNFIYNDMIVGEIQIRFGSKPANFHAAHFLYELIRCDSADQFRQ